MNFRNLALVAVLGTAFIAGCAITALRWRLAWDAALKLPEIDTAPSTAPDTENPNRPVPYQYWVAVALEG